VAAIQINNDQISNASPSDSTLGIDASQKVQAGTVTSTQLASNIAIGNLTVTGVLTGDGSQLTGVTTSSANTAAFANTAGSADTANSALVAATANTAAVATFANTAGTANTATVATSATTADFATLAATANVALSIAGAQRFRRSCQRYLCHKCWYS
jgi:hypothetical protein